MGVKVLDQAQLFYREYGPVTLPYGGDDLPTPEQRRIVYNLTKAAVKNLALAPHAVKIADNSGFCHPALNNLPGIQHDITYPFRPFKLG
jgi:inosine/xanthosine triphosphate pyrophosphatase family protein